ncbi:MAG: hypothetical protein WA160_06840 [Pseudobdellovibrio sp.]
MNKNFLETEGHHVGFMDFNEYVHESFRYKDTNSLNDYDVIFWLLDDAVFYNASVNGRVNRLGFRDRRDKDFENFFHRGGRLIVFLNQIESIQTPIANFPLYNYQLIPGEPMANISKGTLIELIGDSRFGQTWKSLGKYFSYCAKFNKFSGSGLLVARKSTEAVAYLENRQKGKLLVLPKLDLIGSSDQITTDLVSIMNLTISYLFNESKQTEEVAPKWLSKFSLPGELELITKITTLNNEISTIQKKIDSYSTTLENFESNKALLFASGEQLENSVFSALLEMGFSVAKGPQGRDDLIVKIKDQVAVIEIKGVKTSAAEKHSAQLEKWVSNYFIENDLKPKGILIVNAFREIEINKRTNDFPKQMLDFAVKRDHCLLTTRQLLKMLIEFRTKATQVDKIASDIFNTVGILEGYTLTIPS